ncbi:hypothetical protein ACIBCD_26780 [Nocardia brasiliensis]|uniref:hypothetical protein n=1 Tax=Nocardia brasiliensis TaxID=37326 RepID=UPI003788426A
MNTRNTIRAALVAGALVLTATTATAAPTPIAAQDRVCAWRFQPSEPVVKHGAVLVGGYAECRVPPEQLSVRLKLWHRPSGGNWVLKAQDTGAGIPNPYLNFAIHSLDCTPGMWQGEYDMTEVAGGYTRLENGKSVGAIINC